MNAFCCFNLAQACIQTMTKTLHILHFYRICTTQHHRGVAAFRLLQRADVTEYIEGLRQLGSLQFHSFNAKLPPSLILFILVAIVTSWSLVHVRSVDCCRPCYRKSRQDVVFFCLLGFSERPIFGSLSSKQTRRAPVSQWSPVRLSVSAAEGTVRRHPEPQEALAFWLQLLSVLWCSTWLSCRPSFCTLACRRLTGRARTTSRHRKCKQK